MDRHSVQDPGSGLLDPEFRLLKIWWVSEILCTELLGTTADHVREEESSCRLDIHQAERQTPSEDLEEAGACRGT